jgi:transcriptional regulator with XRE-family HTH domain
MENAARAGSREEFPPRRPPLPPEVAAMLAAERIRRGWSYRRAAREAGTSAGYLHMLEHSQRAPSVTMAYNLAEAYRLDETQLGELLEYATDSAGRDWRPPLRWPW